MKTLRWTLFVPVFLFYTTLPQYYMENLTRWGWTLHSNKNVWYINGVSFIMKFAIPIVSFSAFATAAMYLIALLPPNPKLGSKILTPIIIVLVIFEWYNAWGSIDKIDVIFDIEVVLILTLYSLFYPSKTE